MKSSDQPCVEVRREDRLLIISMRREAKRNAINREMADRLDSARSAQASRRGGRRCGIGWRARDRSLLRSCRRVPLGSLRTARSLDRRPSDLRRVVSRAEYAAAQSRARADPDWRPDQFRARPRRRSRQPPDRTGRRSPSRTKTRGPHHAECAPLGSAVSPIRQRMGGQR